MQWQSFLDALSRKVRDSRLPSEMANIKSENELMSYLLADQEVIQLTSLWLEERYNKREMKCSEKAVSSRLVGNREFRMKKYDLCLQSYTKSALYAPADSEHLPVAIANRSASLFYLCRFSECVKDINLAIKLGYPEKLRYKLYLRAVHCYIKLGKRKLARNALLQVREMLNRCDDISNERKEDVEKQIIELSSIAMQDDTDDITDVTESYLRPEITFGENPNFPSASAGIDKKHAPHKGRYVVANRDIKKGQTLFVEKPFAFILLDHDKVSNTCENCCRPYGNTPAPCTSCLDTLFCDINCCTEGWSSYHRWECLGNQMGLWQQIGIAHLALKLLLVCTTTTDTTMFNEVQRLVTNLDNLSTGDLIMYGIAAIMLTLYLAKHTDFFKVNDLRDCLMLKFTDNTLNFDCDLATENNERLYISSLLLRHILQLIPNGNAIIKLTATASEKDKLCVEQQDRIATAVYPSASMMNHSCDPNIMTSFMDQYIIVKATKDIAAGEEVLNCYGPHFRRMSKEERQEILKNQYHFTCKCEPCTLSEYQNFMERFTAMKCPECSGALHNIYSYSLQCLDCGASPTVNYHLELKRAQAAFDAAQVYVELDREEEALVKLKECLSIRRNVLYKYHEDVTATLDFIGKVYAIMERWLDSISYLEHCIAAIEERYGSSSIEVANELNKLTDICIRYLQDEPNTATKWYKNILKKTRRYLDRAEEIINFIYGPWNESCGDISHKKKILSSILKDFNI